MTSHHTTVMAKELLASAEILLDEWLIDNTEHVFEEAPEIDYARTLLIEAISILWPSAT